MFDKMKQLYELQKKAKEIKKELELIVVNVEEMGGKIKISMNGEFKVKSLEIDPYFLSPDKKFELENALKRAIANAVGQTQGQSAGKMKELTKGLNLNIPGL
ncbi:MAG: YbaB/EbfC family nucleoid-associated protein [Candidatus Firestonebacteria bacterium]